MLDRVPEPAAVEYDMFVGGQWTAARSGRRMDSLNPFTGRAWATVPDAEAVDVAAADRSQAAGLGSGRFEVRATA